MWTSTFRAGGLRRYRSAMLFLAELYLPAGSSLASITERARSGVAQAAAAGTRVLFLQAIHLPRDESCFILYQARDASDVAAAGSFAGLAFDRISDAIVSHPAGPNPRSRQEHDQAP